MDLTYDEETCTFRDEVRRFLADNQESFPTKSYDTAEGSLNTAGGIASFSTPDCR